MKNRVRGERLPKSSGVKPMQGLLHQSKGGVQIKHEVEQEAKIHPIANEANTEFPPLEVKKNLH